MFFYYVRVDSICNNGYELRSSFDTIVPNARSNSNRDSISSDKASFENIRNLCIYIYTYNRALINAHCFTNSPPTSHQTRARPLINRPIGQDGERARSPPRCNAFLSSTAAQLILSLRRGRANCVCLPGPARFRGPKHPDTVKVEIQGAKSERKEKN